MKIRNTENNKVVELNAIGLNGIDFLQDFFEGGRLFNGTYNYDDDCYDTDSEGFEAALFSFDDYITTDAETTNDDQWIAESKWLEVIKEESNNN